MGQRSNIIKMVADVLNVDYDMVDITPPEIKINPTGLIVREAAVRSATVMPFPVLLKT